MIITVNEQPLNITDPDEKDLNGTWAKERIDWIRTHKERMYFEFVLSKKDDLGTKLSHPTSTFYAAASRTNPKSGLKEVWKLTDETLYFGEKKLYKAMRMREALEIDITVEDDPMKAFFFHDVFRDHLSEFGYNYRDWNAEASEKNAKDSLRFKVGNLIINTMNKDDVKLRSGALGIDTSKMNEDMMRRKLLETVEARASNRHDKSFTYEIFLEQARSNSKDIILKSYINDAIRKKVISYEGMLIRYADTKDIICKVPATRAKEHVDYLTDYFLNDKEAEELFLLTVEGDIQETAQTAVDYENINNVPSLRKIAKQYGVDEDTANAAKSKDELKSLIREKDIS